MRGDGVEEGMSSEAAAAAEEKPLLPRRRDPGKDAPDYGSTLGKFSVELHHGGFFCGLGSRRCYLEGKIDWFDNCDAETWNRDAIDMMLNELGYPTSLMERVYWLQPGKTLADGLKLTILQRHAKEMAAASLVLDNLVLYVDHVNLLKTQEKPDDVAVSGTPLPSVVCPVSSLKVKKERIPSREDDTLAGSGSDTDLFDSDYDMAEDDGIDDDFF